MAKKTKIVCTIGPASESVETLTKLVNSGMNVARLNFSHGDHEEHLNRIKNIHQVEKNTGKRIGIMLDTKGPEIRTGNMKDHKTITLEKGHEVRVAMNECEGTADKFSISYPELINDVKPGDHILIDDGLVDLKVKSLDKESQEIVCEVENSGDIKDKKGVNVPGVSTNLPGITEKDRDDIKFGLENGIDFIAASFVRKAEDVLEIREILEETNNLDVMIIPKIESQEGIKNIDSILAASDGMMVARGDLGVEVPTEMVPIYQKEIIRKCNEAGKPVITATQMLDSMQRNPRPTRAEASDVANAIFDGTDAVMLSGETAAGDYPVEAVQTMSKIAEATEDALDKRGESKAALISMSDKSVSSAIAEAVATTTENLGIKTIVAATESGHTARLIAKYRPNATIVALTFNENIAHKLLISRGVEPVVVGRPKDTDDMLMLATHAAVESGFAKTGDSIIISAGVPIGESGTTNLMKIQYVGKELVTGQGVGKDTVIGHAVIVNDPEKDADKVTDQSVVVVKDTDERYNDIINKAAAVVVERGGLTSHAAVLAINSGTPVVVGATDATQKIENGQTVTVDPSRGVVLEGASGL